MLPVETSLELREKYSHDWTEDLRFLPDAVALPSTSEELQKVLAYAYERDIPIIPSGGRTGLSGGMLPVYGGWVVSLEKLNRLRRIDTQNLLAVVEAGVITQTLHEAVEAVGLFYPPDPSSRGSCTIGGNIAHNAGGVRAVKYGTTREYVLGLEAFLPDGRPLRTGSATVKNSTGYNLTQLLVGSEGTLAVIHTATLKLLPKPRHVRTLLYGFSDARAAVAAVVEILQNGILPTAIEFMERDAVLFGQAYLGEKLYPGAEEVGGLLLIEVDGTYPETLEAECAEIEKYAFAGGAVRSWYAQTADERERLWKLRRCLGVAVKSSGPYKEEDTVVPRAVLPELLEKVKALGRQYGFRSVCYGHVGDGNLHVNILRDGLDDRAWREEVPKAVEELFRFVVANGGAISGEHGIGWVQRRYMPIQFDPVQLTLMRELKRVFDPKGLLNPGKIFP
ncbi:MAG: FAD-binding protein [Bacteroidia bacterium]|nr:FAD-binding protein [Bacteroidia bacterium]MCX7652838.1 FAD-binding protein [Bacteroidia bacterium]MDW8415946.1 FAD-linked oxidase C-terminal domain-containing protein [Bacteroidia bacterium]